MKRKLLSWNVNGIRAVHRKDALNQVFNLSPEVICLQETKANPETIPYELMDIDGYHAYFSSAERKGYSGVAIYSKEKPQSIKTGFGIEQFDNEGRILIAEYEGISLFNIYFPNGKASKERLQYKLDFYDAFMDYVEWVRNAGKSIIVCGDVNTAHHEIDLARPKENERVSGFLPVEREWMDQFVNKGYVDTFRYLFPEVEKYSWWDMKSRARERNIGWRIDYFFVSIDLKDKLEDAYILTDLMGSDHCPVGIDLQY